MPHLQTLTAFGMPPASSSQSLTCLSGPLSLQRPSKLSQDFNMTPKAIQDLNNPPLGSPALNMPQTFPSPQYPFTRLSQALSMSSRGPPQPSVCPSQLLLGPDM